METTGTASAEWVQISPIEWKTYDERGISVLEVWSPAVGLYQPSRNGRGVVYSTVGPNLTSLAEAKTYAEEKL